LVAEVARGSDLAQDRKGRHFDHLVGAGKADLSFDSATPVPRRTRPADRAGTLSGVESFKGRDWFDALLLVRAEHHARTNRTTAPLGSVEVLYAAEQTDLGPGEQRILSALVLVNPKQRDVRG